MRKDGCSLLLAALGVALVPLTGRHPASWVVAGLLVVVAIARAVGWRRAERRRVLEHGLDLRGWIVQANEALVRGGGGGAPAQVLISFPGRDGATDEQLAELAERASKLKTATPADGDEARVAELVRADSYRPGARALLPGGFTLGVRVYSVHVWVDPALLPSGRLTLPYVQCKALDDASLAVHMVPYDPEA